MPLLAATRTVGLLPSGWAAAVAPAGGLSGGPVGSCGTSEATPAIALSAHLTADPQSAHHNNYTYVPPYPGCYVSVILFWQFSRERNCKEHQVNTCRPESSGLGDPIVAPPDCMNMRKDKVRKVGSSSELSTTTTLATAWIVGALARVPANNTRCCLLRWVHRVHGSTSTNSGW